MGQSIISAVMGIGSRMFSAGAQIVQRLAAGIRSAIGAVTSAISSVTNAVGRFVPGSPVQEGVLTKFNNGAPGFELMSMFAQGMQRFPMGTAMSSAIAPAGAGIGGGGAALAGSGGGGAVISFGDITINAGAGADGRQIADDFEQRLRELLPRAMGEAARSQSRINYRGRG